MSENPEKALKERMKTELLAHFATPSRKIDWTFWSNPDVLANLLRTILLGVPDVVVQLGYRSAINTMRNGKSVWHWNVNIDYIVQSMVLKRVIEQPQTFAESELAQSPWLLEISHVGQIDFHPDMITVIAICSHGNLSAKALGLGEDRDTINVAFELVYDPQLHKQLDSSIQSMETVRLGSLGPLARCHNCRRDQVTLEKCARCKTAAYCSDTCQKSHWKVAHKAVCTKLIQLCLIHMGNCFTKKPV
jgi:rhodanese-related sulfurtransferase